MSKIQFKRILSDFFVPEVMKNDIPNTYIKSGKAI